ncbi:MAG TPA: hypothetical protein VHO46_06615 [Bacteroidales bacterium]|nr:hypothetical protein [Bacteroidales bacterium]
MRAQTFDEPAVGLKSVQTMEIVKVELTGAKTIVHIAVENRIKGGTFCADRNLFIINPDGTKLKLQKASGIPNCPASHKFKNVGEVLEFTLTFPALKQGTGWISIVEECDQNCFSIYGILLNNSFSRSIDEAVAYLDRGQMDTAIGRYINLIGQAGKNEAGITGSLYSDLITLLASKGYTANAAEWYHKLVASDIPWKELYIANLNSRGIKY